MHKKWWFAAIGLSLVFIFLIAAALYSEHQEYRPNENELVNHEKIASHLYELGVDMDTAPTSKIGVLVDSLQFQSSNDVQLTGYIWQTYDNTVISDEQVGIIFPESVGGTSFEERYHEISGNIETIGWYFETVLRQNFDYSKYPIDHKTIWIRMLSGSFVSDLVFLPDLDSYPSTGYEDTFGVDETIVLTGWQTPQGPAAGLPQDHPAHQERLDYVTRMLGSADAYWVSLDPSRSDGRALGAAEARDLGLITQG